jgi:hypothetical protein
MQNADISDNLTPWNLEIRDLFLIFLLDSCLTLSF